MSSPIEADPGSATDLGFSASPRAYKQTPSPSVIASERNEETVALLLSMIVDGSMSDNETYNVAQRLLKENNFDLDVWLRLYPIR